jgi:hypothetical protein
MQDSKQENVKKVGILYRIATVMLLIGNLGLLAYSVVSIVFHSYTVGIMMTGTIFFSVYFVVVLSVIMIIVVFMGILTSNSRDPSKRKFQKRNSIFFFLFHILAFFFHFFFITVGIIFLKMPDVVEGLFLSSQVYRYSMKLIGSVFEYFKFNEIMDASKFLFGLGIYCLCFGGLTLVVIIIGGFYAGLSTSPRVYTL